MKFLMGLALSLSLLTSSTFINKAEAGVIVTGIGTWSTIVEGKSDHLEGGYLALGIGVTLTGIGAVTAVVLTMNMAGAGAILLTLLDEDTPDEDRLLKSNIEKTFAGVIDNPEFAEDIESIVQASAKELNLADDETAYITIPEIELRTYLDENYDLSESEKDFAVLKLSK